MGDLKKNNSGTEAMKLTRLPLTSDYVFKRIFAREENNSMLKDFLEAILNIHINKVEVKNGRWKTWNIRLEIGYR